jgi:hypothetical protein
MKKAYFALRRRTIVTPIWLAALAALVVVAFSTWLWNSADSTIVIVVRNAESGAGGGDAPLGADGRMRADRLALLFGDADSPGRLTAIYVEDSRRSRETAAPLAARLGLTETVAAGGDARSLARGALRRHAGGRVLIVAGRVAIPAIVAEVTGGEEIAPVDPADHGALFVIGVPRIGRANALRLRY